MVILQFHGLQQGADCTGLHSSLTGLHFGYIAKQY
jgi:hypothetical protein